MKNKFFKIFVFLMPLWMSLSSCSDFRKAVGKEKVIPDEFSVAMTPSLIVPPGYNIDPDLFKNNDTIYIELVCFFKNGTGIQRFLAWGSKENKGIKTYCHDIWKNKVPIYYLD